MNNKRALTSVRKLTEAGGVIDYGPDLSRLLVRVMRTLAQGHPVAEEQINQIGTDLEALLTADGSETSKLRGSKKGNRLDL